MHLCCPPVPCYSPRCDGVADREAEKWAAEAAESASRAQVDELRRQAQAAAKEVSLGAARLA